MIEILLGQTITSIDEVEDEELLFHTKEFTLRMYHDLDCCEEVRLEDVCGDLDDIVGSPVLLAECVTNEPEETDAGEKQWTFYKIGTNKGTVTLRWLGESDGYYSIGTDIELLHSDPTRLMGEVLTHAWEYDGMVYIETTKYKHRMYAENIKLLWGGGGKEQEYIEMVRSEEGCVTIRTSKDEYHIKYSSKLRITTSERDESMIKGPLNTFLGIVAKDDTPAYEDAALKLRVTTSDTKRFIGIIKPETVPAHNEEEVEPTGPKYPSTIRVNVGEKYSLVSSCGF